jgi:uncharacterized protein (TIGR03118 family)
MHRSIALAALVAAVGMTNAPRASAAPRFIETDLVSDIAGRAANLDSNLVNPWGIDIGPNGQIRVSDNGSGFSTIYSPTGVSLRPRITIPPAGSGNPTGIVANHTSDFVVMSAGKSGRARFIFDSEDGSISAWTPDVDSVNAITVLSTPDAVYKGIAIDGTATGHFLYAANFRAGTVDVFDGHFAPVHMQGAFSDTTLPDGYAPFDIVNVRGKLYVAYAKQDGAKHDDVPGAGFGYINVFDANGKLLRRLVSQGPLNAPWGMVLAPEGFMSEDNAALLVGNFGDGMINAFSPGTGHFLGALQDTSGKAISISGLWGLALTGGSADDEDGNSQGGDDENWQGQGGNSQGEDGNSQGEDGNSQGEGARTLYFAAGIESEAHGLLGALKVQHHGEDDADEDNGDHDDHALRVSLAHANPVHMGDHSGIEFNVTSDAPRVVALRIYDVAGRLVAEPLHASAVNGSIRTRWNGCDCQGKMVRAGSYFYRAVAQGHKASGHLVVVP